MNSRRWAFQMQALRNAGKFLFMKSVSYAKLMTLDDAKNCHLTLRFVKELHVPLALQCLLVSIYVPLKILHFAHMVIFTITN
jgi:hypothetical protein